MKFRTEYDVRPADVPLDPEKSVVLLGSCFTDSIGRRMRACRWRAFPNICGVLYNPASIANILKIATRHAGIFDTIDDSLTEREGLHMTWLMDSSCTSYSAATTSERVLRKLNELGEALADADTLIVTFGTAWVYELKEKPGYIVSNCHKFPGDIFVRRRLSVAETVGIWAECLSMLRDLHPNLRVIFTVSPVRHLKDGFEGNSRSKAILQLACEEICLGNENAEYFPAYEIINDDLRDYRFYASDLVHPSAEAVEYVWDKFLDRYVTPASRKLLAEGEKVTNALAHRPIITDTSDLGEYMESLGRLKASQRYNAFMTAHPTMLWSDE